jgi:hypothetical protein
MGSSLGFSKLQFSFGFCVGKGGEEGKSEGGQGQR